VGKQDIFDFLKKNANVFFSSYDISRFLDINVQTATSGLKKLEKELSVKQIIGKKGTCHKTTVYAFFNKDDYLEETIIEFNNLRQQPRFQFINADVISNLIIISNLKKIERGLKK